MDKKCSIFRQILFKAVGAVVEVCPIDENAWETCATVEQQWSQNGYKTIVIVVGLPKRERRETDKRLSDIYSSSGTFKV